MPILAEIQNMMTEVKCAPEQFPGTNHLHVIVQRLCMEIERKQCKEYISSYRKSQQKWLRKLQELHHDQCVQQP